MHRAREVVHEDIGGSVLETTDGYCAQKKASRRSFSGRVAALSDNGGSIRIALFIFGALVIALGPTSANPYDLSNILGTAESALAFHTSEFLYWKFGSFYLANEFLALGLAHGISATGIDLAASLQIAAKMLSIMADALGAWALADIARTLCPSKSNLVVMIWLLSPAVIWVSAGDAQIETISGALILLGISAALKERDMLAGFCIGVGIGFEYLPALTIGMYIVQVVSRHARLRRFLLSGLGICIGTTASFLPNLLSPLGRSSLVESLLTGSGAITDHAQTLAGSIWALLPNENLFRVAAEHWIEVMAVMAIVIIFVLAFRGQQNGSVIGQSVACVGVLLLSVLVVEPTFLPQFSVLILVGVCLLALGTGSGNMLAVGYFVSMLPIFAWFLSSPIASFFEDVYPTVFSHPLPSITTTAISAMTANTLDGITCYLVIIVCISTLSGSRLFHGVNRGLQMVASVVSPVLALAILSIFVWWSASVGMVTRYFTSGVETLFDTPYTTVVRQAQQVSIRENTVNIKFSKLQIEALPTNGVSPKLFVTYTPRIFGSSRVGGEVKGSLEIPVGILRSRGNAAVIRGVGLQLLLNNAGHGETHIGHSWRMINIFGKWIAPVSSTPSAGGWELVTYAIPIQYNNLRGLLTVHLRNGVVSNASKTGKPWLAIWADRGVWRYDRNGVTVPAAFSARSALGGRAEILGRPQRFTQLRISSLSALASGGVWAELKWSNGVSRIDESVGGVLTVVGSFYGVFLLFITIYYCGLIVKNRELY